MIRNYSMVNIISNCLDPLNKAPLNQLGPGCLIDQLVGLEISRIAGLPNFLDNDHVKSALQSIFKYNFKPNMRANMKIMRNFMRSMMKPRLLFAHGLMGDGPKFLFRYADEVMNGFEYQFGVHCIIEGLIEEGLTVVKSIRDRFDGFGRNPWDELNCGRSLWRFDGFRMDCGLHYQVFNLIKMPALLALVLS